VGVATGRRAGLTVRKHAKTVQRKFASFHDLRRTFALRRAKVLMR
jgi:hypothetical protein